MSYQRIQVIACTVTGSLPGLSHDVSHIDNRGTGIDQRFPHAADQQGGYHARIETSWAQYHHIRLSDTFQCQGKRSAIRRLQPDAAHRTRGSADAGLSLYISAILQMGMKSHVMCRTGKHSPSDSQDLAGLPHCFVEVSKNLGKSSEKQITQAVPFQAPGSETMREECAHERFIIRQGNQTVAHVSGWQNSQLLPQSAGRTSFVRNIDHSGRMRRPFSEPTKQGGESGPATNGHYPKVSRSRRGHVLFKPDGQHPCAVPHCSHLRSRPGGPPAPPPEPQIYVFPPCTRRPRPTGSSVPVSYTHLTLPTNREV